MRMRVCHICGVPQGLRGKTFDNHYKLCSRNWLFDEAKKPKGSQRSLPAAPDLPPPDDAMATDDIARYNAEAQRIWKTEALEQCPNCGKSMNPIALAHHIRSMRNHLDRHRDPLRIRSRRPRARCLQSCP